MGKQVAIIGLGRFGTSLATNLYDSGYEVLAIDKDAELVENISARVTHAARTDATHEASLRKLGIDKFDVVVVAVGASIQDSVMTTILLKKLGVHYIVARADNELHGQILENIGADKILFPERDTAMRTGPILTVKGVTDYIPLTNGFGIIKAKAPEYFIGKTLEDIGFTTNVRPGAAILLIQRGKECLVNPKPQEVVSHIDYLVVAGNASDLELLLEKTGETSAQKRAGNGQG